MSEGQGLTGLMVRKLLNCTPDELDLMVRSGEIHRLDKEDLYDRSECEKVAARRRIKAKGAGEEHIYAGDYFDGVLA